MMLGWGTVTRSILEPHTGLVDNLQGRQLVRIKAGAIDRTRSII